MPPRGGEGVWRANRGSGSGSGILRSQSAPQSRMNASRSSQATGPPKSSMHLVASISRSSELQTDGDTLKDPTVQKNYWQFILDRLDRHWDEHESQSLAPRDKTAIQQRDESRENLLILLRKLREGLIAIRRIDAFAMEVYETSLLVAVVFDSAKYMTALASQLPDVYKQLDIQKPSTNPTPAPLPPPRDTPSTIALLGILVLSYPSQSTHAKLLRSFSDRGFSPTSTNGQWLKSVASALRTSNFFRVDRLTSPPNRPPLFDSSPSQTRSGCPKAQLGSLAGNALLDRLRDKARPHTWTVLRVAYSQFACQAGSPTRQWLARSLRVSGVTSGGEGEVALDGWLSSRSEAGEIELKEGVEGRWVVVMKS